MKLTDGKARTREGHIICVYKIICIATGQYYIGSTCQLARRIYDHAKLLRRNCHHCPKLQSAFNTHGANNFIVLIVSRFSSLSLARECEQELLDIDFESLLNKQNLAGGREIKFRPLWAITEDKKIRYENARQAEEKTGVQSSKIYSAIRESKKQSGRYWTNDANATYRSMTPDRVFMFDLKGQLVKSFRTITKAAEATGISGSLISAVMSEKRRYCQSGGGYLWSRTNVPPNNESRRTKSVVQKTRSGEIVKQWGSAREAALKTLANYKGISDCVSGRQKTSGGFVWEFAVT